jgi:NitT/TauT family transport system substrate-binding protein
LEVVVSTQSPRIVISAIIVLLALACGPGAGLPIRPAAQPAGAPPPAAPPPAAAAAPAPSAAPAPAAAASAQRPLDPPLSPPVTVRVGVVGATSDAGLYIAQERGYFREQGIEIDLGQFQAAQQMVPLLATGQLDVGGGGTSAGLLNAVAQDVPLRIVADKGSMPPGFGFGAVVLRKELAEGGSFGCANFKGLRMGTAAVANSFAPSLERMLRDCGLAMSDLDMVEIAYPDVPAALRNGSLDASHLLEPQITRGLAEGVFALYKRQDEFYPDQQTAVLLYGPHFIANQREAGQRLMIAYIKGMRDHWDAFTRGVNKAEIVDILTRTTVVKDPALFAVMTPAGLNPDGYINMRTFADDVEWWSNRGYVRTRVDPNQVVDNSFVDYAIERLGRYSAR